MHRARAESRKGEKPIIMLGDRTGEVVSTFGLMDIIMNLPYSVMFLVDSKGGVEAVKVTDRGILCVRGMGEVLDFAKEAFAIEETENKVEDTA